MVLVGLAAAASVAGFSTPGARAGHGGALQVAGLFDETRTYGQGTALVFTHWRNLGVDVELTGLAGVGSAGWSDAAPGTLRVGVRAFFGHPGVQHALGVDFRAGFADERVGFWVVRYDDALTVAHPRLTWDVTAGPPHAALSMRVAVGYSPTTSGLEGVPAIFGAGTGVSVAKVFPIGVSWAAVVEGEAVVDGTPFAARAALRWRADPHWSVDAWVSVPMPLFFTHPVFLPALQLRGEL